MWDVMDALRRNLFLIRPHLTYGSEKRYDALGRIGRNFGVFIILYREIYIYFH